MSKAQEILNIMTEAGIFQKGPFVFTTEGVEDNRVKGTLAYAGKAYNGYVSYDNDVGISWNFEPALPEDVAENDAWIDLTIQLLSYHNDGLEIE